MRFEAFSLGKKFGQPEANEDSFVVIPGAGYAQMATQQMQAAQMQRQAQQNMAQMNEMMERMLPIMPQMMRGQRLYELGQARQCAFVQHGAAE